MGYADLFLVKRFTASSSVLSPKAFLVLLTTVKDGALEPERNFDITDCETPIFLAISSCVILAPILFRIYNMTICNLFQVKILLYGVSGYYDYML